MDAVWIAFFVIFGIVIVALIVYGIVICVRSNEEYGVTAPSPVEDTLEDERCKHELLGHSSVLDELLDYTPIATDPIPDEILKNYK